MHKPCADMPFNTALSAGTCRYNCRYPRQGLEFFDICGDNIQDITGFTSYQEVNCQHSVTQHIILVQVV